MSASAPILRVEHLTVDYTSTRGLPVRAVDDATFEIGVGEVVALVGESGSGKSTIARTILGLTDPGAVSAGSIQQSGSDLLTLSERGWRTVRGRRIALVPQDPALSLDPVRRIGLQIGDVAVLHGIVPRRGSAALVEELLERVGIADPGHVARQYPHELSGGMRQRVLIAMALTCSPDLIVADEPTSALDVTVQKQVLDALSRLQQETGTAVLLVTHDLAVASDRADRILVMKEGQIVEEGTAAQVVHAPQTEYAQRLLAAVPRFAAAIDRVPTAPAAELARVSDISKNFGRGRRRQQAVDRVSFSIRSGETVSLVGESGSGKTTTARMLAGLTAPTEGSIVVGGVDLAALPRRDARGFRRSVQFVHQNPAAALHPRQGVRQIVQEPLLAFGVGDRSSRAAAAIEVLDAVGLPQALHDRLPRELSGGQAQRVAIARAMILKPDLVILDEPVSALDVSVQAQILRLLLDLQAEHRVAYLFVSHDLAVVRQISDRVVVMRGGQIVEQGATESVFQTPREQYTRALIEAIPGERLLEG